jgi:hypothetical protein
VPWRNKKGKRKTKENRTIDLSGERQEEVSCENVEE